MEELLSLKWNNHHSILLNMLNIIRQQELYTDVTLVCEGKFYNVHKVVLATCSLYFNEIFSKISCSNPVIILREIKFKDLEYLLDYMYIGECKVKQGELNNLIKTAEHLKIKGLAEADNEILQNDNSSETIELINEKEQTDEDTPDEFGGKRNRKKVINSTASKKRRKYVEKRDVDVDTFMTTELSGSSEMTNCGKNDDDNELIYIKSESVPPSETPDNFIGPDKMEDSFEYPTGYLNSSAENTTDELNVLPGGSDNFKPLTDKYDSLNSASLSDSALNEYEYSSSVAKNMTEVRKITCRVCSKKMKWPSQLLVHMRTHTGEKPFQCSHCDKRFSQKIHRKRHMLIKHHIDSNDFDD